MMGTEPKQGNVRRDFVLAISSGLVGAVLSSFIMWKTFYENLETVTKVEQTNLITDLRREFYNAESTYAKIHNAMYERDGGKCVALYKEWKNENGKSGDFDHAQITEYLSFFENLGYFAKEKTVDVGLINEFFGSAFAEAYHREELQIFIGRIQRRNKQAYKLFQNLANEEPLKNHPDFDIYENKTCWQWSPDMR